MITIIDYKKGNLQSVARGLFSVGAETVITDDPDVIASADTLVLPGVGAFADAMETIRQLGQDKAIFSALDNGAHFLGICLGMQLMFEYGDEHAEINGPTKGLGLIPGHVTLLPKANQSGGPFKIPHVGWNSVDYVMADANGDACATSAQMDGCGSDPIFADIPDGSYFYFTHSFRAPESACTIGITTHSVTFPSAVRVGRAYGVQFHPEKSSDVGMRLLENFVQIARG